ncbi:MAG: hypothetical protein HFF20_04915 [Oscillospiraceae bacterium]|jgi:hypothetical protein|nr:hypothetical protein [Oscillospiraceae bacterium]
MGEYITKKEDMKFQSQEALVPVQNVIDEAGKVLNDPSLRVEDSAISGAITGALGAGAGGALGFAGLYFGGTVGLSAVGITSGLAAAGGLVGGGMVAGLGVLAAPAVILGIIGAAIGAASEEEKLHEAKELVYKNVGVDNIVISLVHGLFCTEGEDKDLFECRTRKILLISNSIASTSTIIHAGITANPKNLDIGSLLNTITHLFTDIHFILRVKQEFIDSEISSRLQKELDEVDRLYETI